MRSSGVLAAIVMLTAMIGATVGALQQPVMITQPSDWVPMTFDLRIVPDGDEANALSYTEYRSSDGSVRFEAHDGKEVQLHNRRKGLYYDYFNGEWTEQPLRS